MLARRLRVSPSMVVALVALMIALGGTSYAAVQLTARSVGARELKRQAVTRVHIKNDAVDGSKVAKDSLTGSDIKESSLSGIASALSAARSDQATSSDHATAAAAIDKVTYRGTTGSVDLAPANTTTTSPPTTASCDAGQVVVGGGVKVDDPASLAVHESYPNGARAWTATVGNDDANPHTFTVFAICIAATTIG